jgi:hypothetical protein
MRMMLGFFASAAYADATPPSNVSTASGARNILASRESLVFIRFVSLGWLMATVMGVS